MRGCRWAPGGGRGGQKIGRLLSITSFGHPPATNCAHFRSTFGFKNGVPSEKSPKNSPPKLPKSAKNAFLGHFISPRAGSGPVVFRFFTVFTTFYHFSIFIIYSYYSFFWSQNFLIFYLFRKNIHFHYI